MSKEKDPGDNKEENVCQKRRLRSNEDDVSWGGQLLATKYPRGAFQLKTPD